MRIGARALIVVGGRLGRRRRRQRWWRVRRRRWRGRRWRRRVDDVVGIRRGKGSDRWRRRARRRHVSQLNRTLGHLACTERRIEPVALIFGKSTIAPGFGKPLVIHNGSTGTTARGLCSIRTLVGHGANAAVVAPAIGNEAAVQDLLVEAFLVEMCNTRCVHPARVATRTCGSIDLIIGTRRVGNCITRALVCATR